MTYWKSLVIEWKYCIPLAILIGVGWGWSVRAQDAATIDYATPAGLKVGLDTMWTLFAGFLVFFMNAGFALVESGMCRVKNAVNILSKNLIVFALSTIAYWAIGFAFMFGDGSPVIGLNGFFLSGADNSPATADAYEGVFSALSWTGIPLTAKFFFQLVFAGTAATIVSGAVAERIKFIDFLIFSLVIVGVIYPIGGHWIWGGGFLAQWGFWDFAGCTVVHSIGGWCALMGAYFLGPRLGRYVNGQVVAMPGHNLGLATLGCLILWLGWFGFNPGSTMALDANLIGHIALTTNLGGSAGAIAATIVAWVKFGKPDLTMIINGILAGLVAVTASCAFISAGSAVIIGAIGGVLVVFAVGFFDSIKIDDPVGAVSVHLVNGIWGTLALGLFAQSPWAPEAMGNGLLFGGGSKLLFAQIIGILMVGALSVALSSITWLALKSVLGLRVTPEEEYEGLDLGEHGMVAYSGFATEVDSDAPIMEGGNLGKASSVRGFPD
ncbi:ammonium transporter [Leptolyngbya sp. FACHB-261]|uniref:ammonium transporter n=1 Tax=Leptolyngbya sp. FACHB-261 TaxID=2692806 RepID=UPI001F559ADB|nr:ammonium transporter [Leptolyngbya sp. FACHB-261]